MSVRQEQISRVQLPGDGQVEIRVTLRWPYRDVGCPGHTDVSARQGHYIKGRTLFEAIGKMYETFKGVYNETIMDAGFDVQWWGDDDRRGMLIE